MAYFVLTSVLLVSLAGATLGRRFSALVLVPASIIAVVAIALFGTALSASFWTCMVAGVLGLSCLQLGYLAAVGLSRFNEQPYRAAQPELEQELVSLHLHDLEAGPPHYFEVEAQRPIVYVP